MSFGSAKPQAPAPMEAAELKEARKQAFEELSAALDTISVKSIIDFRGRLEVPRPVESVAAASVALVARVDESAEDSSGSVVPRSWAAAQAAMAKPGHFINSLRRFPYAVDSGRMPDADVQAARSCLEDVSREHLASEPAALNLHQWVVSALRYCEVQRVLSVANNPASPKAGTADGAQVSSFLSTPPVSPPRADEGSPNRNVIGRIARSFPDLAPKSETPPGAAKKDAGPGSSIKVRILGARGLPSEGSFMEYGPYCVCEIVNREGSKVQTKYTGRTAEPVFNEEFDISGYYRGDTLLFALYDKEMWPKSDVFLGKAELKLLPEGFDGELPLQDTAEGVTASVRIHITPLGIQGGRQAATPGTSALDKSAAPSGRMSTGSTSRRTRSPQMSPVPAATSQTPSTASPVRSGRTSGASAMTPKATGPSQVTRRPAPVSRFSAAPARPSTSSTGSLRITPSASPASTRKSPGRSPPSAMLSRRPMSATAPAPGYSSQEELTRKLDQMRREAREMKSKEAQIKWSMKREEEKLRKSEAKEAVKDHLTLQQTFSKGIQEYAKERSSAGKNQLLRESRDFQEFKRSAKVIDREVDQRWIKEEYSATKENSEYVTELARTVPLEEQRVKVEENLERYRVFAEHNLEEQQRNKIDYTAAELARQGAELDLQLLQAKQEHDAALQSLEYIRNSQQVPPRNEKHLPTRPFTPLNRGL
mmetsp:Transcript_36208/g.63798  ORF Transcript_36208/g.63798 Transcript_36208/m.63798 type:complete len:708 (+) Transcript_36208:116-2239(+)